MNLTNTPRIETERLILRKFTENDLEAFFLIYSDKEANTYLPWFPAESREEAKALLEDRYLKKYRNSSGYNYAVCLKHDDIPIGYVNVSMEDSHDFGYGLRREFWRKGIATEAGLAVISQMKRDNIPYITATHDVNNPRSGNVMRRLGMTYRYSYEEQWQPKDILVTFRMYQLNLNVEREYVYRKYWDISKVRYIESI